MRRRSVTRVALAFRSALVAWTRGTATAPESRPRPWASGEHMHAKQHEHWPSDLDYPDSGFEHVVMEATPDPGRPGPAQERPGRHALSRQSLPGLHHGAIAARRPLPAGTVLVPGRLIGRILLRPVLPGCRPHPGPAHPVDRLCAGPGPAGHRRRRDGAVMEPTRSMEPPVPGRPGRLPHGRAGHPDRDLGPAPDHRDAGTAQPARPGATGPPDRRLRQRAQAFFAAVRPRQEFQASEARILAAHDLAGHAAG